MGTVIEMKNGIQKAWHGVAGFEIDLTKRLKVNLEGYYKVLQPDDQRESEQDF